MKQERSIGRKLRSILEDTRTSTAVSSACALADKSSLNEIKNARAIVLLTDWLPPEFSAVSQYAELIAREEAENGANVVLIGTRSTENKDTVLRLGRGSLRIIGIRRPMVIRGKWFHRLMWALATNVALIARAWPYLRSCDVIRFSGAPPFMLQVVSAANLVLRKRLVYRITDFYPECIAAALGREPLPLKAVRILTYWLRRRIDQFEVLGLDMKQRLLECGVHPERIVLRRDRSPVEIRSDTPPLPIPELFKGKKVLLYSGNWGVAHDIDTFVAGYTKHHRKGSGNVVLWLNATGAGADEVARRLSAAMLPFFRQNLVPLVDLPRLLVTPDAHLITLRPGFVGLVLPSKVYGCIESGRSIIYVGSRRSDIHLLCEKGARTKYFHVAPGDADAIAKLLEHV